MTTDAGYAEWLRSNAAPDLQTLVQRHGGCDRTPEAWAEYDRAVAEWQERRRRRSEGGPAGEIPHSDRSDADRLCICGLPGVYWRPRKGGGRAIWRCDEHRDAWPDYAIEAPQRRRAGAVP
jgi:hypothetical protein